MGCFNHTCAVSNLPVEYNDELVVIILAANKFMYPGRQNQGLIYSTHYYEPFGFPFRARYNDYGWIEDEEKSVFLDWTLDQIDKNLIERSIGPNKYHDPEVVRGQMTVDYLGNLLWEDRLRLDNPVSRGVYREQGDEPLSPYKSTAYMFIHKHVYETLIKDFTERYYHYDSKKYQTWSMNSYGQNLKGALERFVTGDDELSGLKNFRLEYDFDDNFPTAKNLLSIRKDVPGLDQDELIRRLSEIAAFDLCMSRLHKLYMPQRSGSQDGAPKRLFESLTRAMRTVIKDKHKRNEE